MQDYQLGAGWKTFFWIIGVIALPIFLLGVPVIMIALKANVTIDDDKLGYWWLGQKEIPWAGMSVARAPAAGVLGAMMSPLRVTNAEGKGFNLPVGTFNGTEQIIAVLKERSGSEF